MCVCVCLCVYISMPCVMCVWGCLYSVCVCVRVCVVRGGLDMSEGVLV